MEVSSSRQQLVRGDVDPKFGCQLGAKGAVEAQQQEHGQTHQEIEPLDLASQVLTPEKALEAAP